MTDERTQGKDFGQLQKEQNEPMVQGAQQASQQTTKTVGAVICQRCGSLNQEGSINCSSCGAELFSGRCPHCNSPMDADSDFCEVCHRYIRRDICSFCGAHLAPQDSFCPECGSPRGGIVCPTCHTLNDFAFCKQCGTPLTDEAWQIVMQMKQMPEYKEMVMLAREYDELSLESPYTSERDVNRDRAMEQMRERVLKLLAQDEGVPNPVVPKITKKRLSKEELSKKKEEKLARLAELLDKMQMPPNPSPAHVRNYAMAQKPAGVRLAWVCNWKHAMHSSPCGCAKPQLGGKWVILGRGSKQEVKDDN
jgi:predicted amidophosphoribosyltransferase